MPTKVIFEEGNHKVLLLEDFGSGKMVQANQFVIIHDGHGMILDPGGHKVYNKAFVETTQVLGKKGKLDHIFLSQSDPDIVAAINSWLMTTDADARVPELWIRFVPHFGIDEFVLERLKPIPDTGMTMDLGGSPLYIVPGHFLHSVGNFQVYDPISKILFSGDLGASIDSGGGELDYDVVTNFSEHAKFMEGFHKRYMHNNAALKAWGAMARQMDIETIAPQHGARFEGNTMVKIFINWAEALECGTDYLLDFYTLPEGLR